MCVDKIFTAESPIHKKVQTILKDSGAKDINYNGLTDNIIDNKAFKWEDIHNYRESIYNCIAENLSNNEGYVFEPMGSKKQNSDIDITIFKKGIETTLYFCIGFGYYIKNTHEYKEDITKTLDYKEGLNRTELIQLYLNEFQDKFDIVPYSTNGVIIIKPGQQSASTYSDLIMSRMLRPIQTTSQEITYQVIHNPNCDDQRQLFMIEAYISIKKLNELKNNSNANDILTSIEKKYIGTSEDAKELMKLSNNTENKLEMLKRQLYSTSLSMEAEEYLSQNMMIDNQLLLKQFNEFNNKTPEKEKEKEINELVNNYNKTCFEMYCTSAYIWEYNQMVGNMATPEAAHFVQTFVSTVLLGQRKMLYQLEMTYDSIWISLLENYYSILHNKGDLRKMYKYTQRSIKLIYLLTGECRKFITKKGDVFSFEQKALGEDIENCLRNFDSKDCKLSVPLKAELVLEDADINHSVHNKIYTNDRFINLIKGRIDKIIEFIEDNIYTTFLPVRLKFLDKCTS